MKRSLSVAMFLSAVTCCFLACSAIDPRSPTACVAREGECFDLSINGVRVVPISSTSKSLLARYMSRLRAAEKADLHYTQWETETLISGKLSYNGSANYRGSFWFGAESGLTDPIVIPLDGQDLKFTSSITSSAPGDPRGVALLSKSLAQDTLPPGNYIFVIDYSGNDNWDRKHILVKVR
jgi:hypothetical protein